jgi:integrase
MALTDLQVRKFKPKKRRFEVLDQAGLYVRIAPGGRKTWVFRYFFEGVPRRMQLGVFPGISLAKAREKHGAALVEVQRGIDPGAKLQAEKAKRKAAPNFQDLLGEFWGMELKAKQTGKERRRLIEKDALPVWKNRKVNSITRRDAVLLLDKVRQRAPVGANRLQSVLVRMFNFAAERGIVEMSALTGLRKTTETPRRRVLTDEEIKLLWKGTELENKDIDMYCLTKLAIRLLLLTGQRCGEVAGMRWDEIENNFWNIPAGRTKNAESHRVPLLPMSLEVLEQAKVYSGNSPFVFQSSYKPEKPIIRQAITRAVSRHRAEMGIEKHFTPHDLRRTLRTKLAELGVDDVIAERVLGHKLQGLLAVYNRYGYDAEKRKALSLWEQRLSKIIGYSETVSNVIPFVR